MRSRLLSAAIITATAVATTFAVACSSDKSLQPFSGLLSLGTWGGDKAAMIVSDTAMHLHVGCTYGDVSGRIAVAADGTFDVAGSYMLHAFPIAIGPSVPARFVGHVTEGAVAVVTVSVNDTVGHQTMTLGPVNVALGVPPIALPCPICSRPVITQR